MKRTKHLRETFTEQEFEQLKQAKTQSGKNWHYFLLSLTLEVDDPFDVPENDIVDKDGYPMDNNNPTFVDDNEKEWQEYWKRKGYRTIQFRKVEEVKT